MIIETKTTQEYLEQIYQSDKQAFDDFVSSKSPTINYASLKRLVLSELTLKKQIVIIEKVLSMIKFNVNIELLLDYFIIEMRKASD